MITQHMSKKANEILDDILDALKDEIPRLKKNAFKKSIKDAIKAKRKV